VISERMFMTATEALRAADRMPRHFTCIYVCRNGDGEVIYVGQSRQWPQRLRCHAVQTVWWHEVATVELLPTSTNKRARLDHESAVIRIHQPRHNTMRTEVEPDMRRRAADNARMTRATRRAEQAVQARFGIPRQMGSAEVANHGDDPALTP
jgi:excinuclease UvrABC nuclease subunit